MTSSDLVKIMIRSSKQSIGLMEESMGIAWENKTVLMKRSKFLASLSAEELNRALNDNRRRNDRHGL